MGTHCLTEVTSKNIMKFWPLQLFSSLVFAPYWPCLIQCPIHTHMPCLMNPGILHLHMVEPSVESRFFTRQLLTGLAVENFHAMDTSQQMFPRLRVATTLEKELWGAISLSGEAAPLDLRQCSSSPTVELSLKSGRGTTMIGTMSTGPCLMPHARDRSGTRATTWAQATAPHTRASPAVATVTVWETLSVLAAEILLCK